MQKPAQLVVAANRLPIRKVTSARTGKIQWKTSPGGLTSALAPALKKAGGVRWVGWPGEASNEVTKPFDSDGIKLVPVSMTAEQKSSHYDGMSNGTLWPLYHDKVKPAEFHRSWFDGYKKVNQVFADAITEVAEPNAIVWVHDYQLQLVPQRIRSQRPDLRIGFFLHIPFPPPEIFAQLPWRDHIARGILGSDVIGFHTPESCHNFKRFITNYRIVDRSESRKEQINYDNRKIVINSFPIGIAYKRYEEKAAEPAVEEMAEKLRKEMGNPQKVLLGVDRLDYTKGIDIRLRAFRELLEEKQINPAEVSMIQVAAPSRNETKAYNTMRSTVEQLTGQINGRFSKVGMPAIHYINRTQSTKEIMALYRAADIMLVTPFRDGMNLVAMEYVAARYDQTGSLILSEFAGAAHLLSDALLVNPYDIKGLKEAIMQAITMDTEEERQRMGKLRLATQGNDVSSWATSFLDAFPKKQ